MNLKIVVIAFILVGVIVLIVFAMLRKKKMEQERIQTQQLKYQKILSDAQIEFFENIKKFYGLFGCLNEAVIEKDATKAEEMFERWKEMAENLPNFIQVLEIFCVGDALNRASSLLEQIEKWGVCHDTKGMVLTASDDINKLYIMKAYYADEQKIIVKKVAWYYQKAGKNICIENGIAEIYEEKK